MSKKLWDEAASAEDNARQRLPGLAEAYFAEGRELAAGQPAAPELHAFRMKTKRFRYTLEMFRPVYGESLEDYLGALRKVQTSLGDINDCAAARTRLDGLMAPTSPQHRRVDRFLDDRQAALTADFLKFWREEFDAEGEEARWRAFLGGAEVQPKPLLVQAPAPRA